MKRIVFITLLGLTTLYSRANFEYNGLFYEYISTTEKTVAVTGFNNQVDELTIPDSIEVSGTKYSVEKIGLGQRLFGDSRSPRILHLPHTITEISSNAFKEWSTLEKVDFPNDPNSPNQLATIGRYAFYTCKNLKFVSLPNSPFSIQYAAFEGCNKMEELDLGGAESIGDHAFYICTSLKSIILPKSVVEIGEWAFSSSAQLQSIAVENGNAYFDSRNDCNAIIEKATGKLVVGCSTTIIPDGTKIIGDRAFYGCRNMTAIELPNTIETIGRFAFSCCSSLKSIELPESLIYIKKYAFESCPITEVTIPENVKNIGYNAFYSTRDIRLKWLHFNAIDCTFGEIEDSTYGDFFTTQVDSISFGDKVKYLNRGFFSTGFLNQRDIVFPNSLIGIDYYVFNQTKLGNLTFGSNLEFVYGFFYLTSLESITILAETPPRNSTDTFMRLAKSETPLYVPQESVDLYKNDNLWGKFFIVGIDGVDGVENDEEKIVTKKYYDLYGRERIYPNENEILIKVTLYDNGKTKSEKVLFNNNRTSAK